MLITTNMKTRQYTMKARAVAQRETIAHILRAGSALLWEKLSPEITLAEVAGRAGVSVQTILRHFGTREHLLAAAEDFLRQEIRAEREAPAGDLPAAVRAIYDHYELRGDAVLRMLAQEYWNEHLRAINDSGRAQHRQWVEAVFRPQLAAFAESERAALVDLLVVATDAYTWKLLRRDRGLSRMEAEARTRRLIAAILRGEKGE